MILILFFYFCRYFIDYEYWVLLGRMGACVGIFCRCAYLDGFDVGSLVGRILFVGRIKGLFILKFKGRVLFI